MTKRAVELTLNAEITIRAMLLAEQTRIVKMHGLFNSRQRYEIAAYWTEMHKEVRDAYEQLTGEPMPYPEL